MKSYIIALTTTLGISSVSVFSQTTLPMYSLAKTEFNGADADARLRKYIDELNLCDIHIQIPSGYKSIDMRCRTHIYENISSAWGENIPAHEICPVALESDNNDALLLLFPRIFFGTPESSIRCGYAIESELKAAAHDQSLDVTPLVNITYNDDKSAYSGADTIAVYEFKFENLLLNQYKYCIGLYLRSYAHPALLLKIALTPRAYKNKDKYIKLMFDIIQIGNNPVDRFIEVEKKSYGIFDLYFIKKE